MKRSPKPIHGGIVYAFAIWLLVFATGWFVMLTELVGARVLSPYFGNTIYVWGSVIAIFLLALAVGYAIGGRLTQRFSSPLVPVAFAAVAGLYVALTPYYQDALCKSLYMSGMNVKWGALLASIALYGLPMCLLGGISPYAIQLATKTHVEVGRRAGMLYALSTIGSFAGSLVTAFALIPGFTLSAILTGTGIMLVVVVGVVALALAEKLVPAGILAAALGVGIVLAIAGRPGKAWQSDIKAYQYPLKGGPLTNYTPKQFFGKLAELQMQAVDDARTYMQQEDSKVLLSTETPYHRITVQQWGPVRRLVFGDPECRGAQNAIDLRNLPWHVAEYTQMAFAGLLYRPVPKRVCVIGVGGAVMPRALECCFPGVEVDAIDIDPTVIRIAQEFFYWQPSRNVRVYAQDGRLFLNYAMVNNAPKYDWIILDAYEDDYVPFHLTTQEFIRVCRRMLAPDGVLVANLTITNSVYGAEARTYKAEFGNANAFCGRRSGNIILVAQNGRKKPLTVSEASKAAMKLKLPASSGVDTRFLVGCLLDGQNWKDDGPRLTDVCAPVENLIE